jgi:nicotinamidase/pyrazinamidase
MEASLKRFVVVVDTQWDFMAAEGALSVNGAEALLVPMQNWLQALSPDDVEGVLFTFDTHVPEIYRDSEEAKSFPIHSRLASGKGRV